MEQKLVKMYDMYLLIFLTAPEKYPANLRGVPKKANELSITWTVSRKILAYYLSSYTFA